MYRSIKISKKYEEQAATLRKKYYGPDAKATDYRSMYLFGKAIDEFDETNYDKSAEYIAKDNLDRKIQKTVTLRSASFAKLERIATLTKATDTAVFRAIIHYSLEHIIPQDITSKPIIQELSMKLKILESKSNEIAGLILEIQEAFNNFKEEKK